MNSRVLGLLAFLLAGTGWLHAQVPSANSLPASNGGYVASSPTYGNGMANGPSVFADGGMVEDGFVLYGSVDYLLWQIRKGNLPQTTTSVPVGLISVDISDLFSVSPSGDPNFPGASTVGYAPVSIVNQSSFGAGPFTNIGSQSGGRFNFGFWIDQDMTLGMEAGFFFLERGVDRFAALSSQQGNQFILDTGFTRTLFVIDVATGASTPLRTFQVFGVREATSSLVGSASVTLYGAELNTRSVGMRLGGIDVGGLAGFRFLSFKDELAVANGLRLFRPVGFAPTSGDETASLSQDLSFNTLDRVRVWNRFYGGQVGIDIDGKFGDFFITGRAKVAVGAMAQVAQVESRTTVVNNDPLHLSPPSYGSNGGLLASPADNGRHSRTRFAFVPEGGVKVGYQFTDWLRGYVGYDVILLGHVARAGSSTSITTLNTTVRVGTTPDVNLNLSQPTFRFRDQDVWVQGVTFGMEVKY